MWPFKSSKVNTSDELRAQIADVRQQMLAVGVSSRVADGLTNLVAGLGTARDKRVHTGYALVRPLTYVELETYWRSNWLCKNIVEGRGNDMVREWVNLQWDGKDTDTNRQQAVEDGSLEHGVLEKFRDGVNWGRLYGGAAVVMGVADGMPLDQPLNEKALGKGCLQYLHVFDRWQMSALELMDKEPDLLSPNFRKPRYFVLGGGEADAGVRVHWSRVLVFHGRRVPYRPWLQNGMWHDSELQHVMDDVKDYGAVMALLATMFFEANVDVVGLVGLSKTLAMKNGEDIINKRFNIAAVQKSANRMLMMDADDKYDKKGNNFTGLGNIVDAFRTNVCAASRTPPTVLFGDSPNGLSANGLNEVKVYENSIKQEQQMNLRPVLSRFYRVFLTHLFGAVPTGFHFEFNPITQESKSERSARESQDAQRDKTYVDLGAMSPHGIAKELKENKVYKTQEDADVDGANDFNDQQADKEAKDAAEAERFDKTIAAKQTPKSLGQ